MIKKSVLAAFLLSAGWLLVSCDTGTGPEAPALPEDSDSTEQRPWQEVLADDPAYPANVYLTQFVSWSPGKVGSSRRDSEYCDSEGFPLINLTLNALGPPEGGGSYTGGSGLTCPVGINGSAVWMFDADAVIVNGPGEDFVTFAKTWAWDRQADGLCCELGRIEVSEDALTWYELDASRITYDSNPNPRESNSSYVYAHVSGLHGNAPTWANFRQEMQAESLEDIAGTATWTDLTGVTISRYFMAGDSHLGGVYFNLDDFHLKGDDAVPWPAGGKMRYIKLIDDETILDGQDYAKSWSLGANMMAAMGINTEMAP